ncbi:MAG: hypothetical protein QN141_07725 [Armatimonadota bacterium]|nr:hypothetical protein [Armatimonadota bacterium]MDR7450253.1 hypothetical protein [Armatimonadota bacterium]MDR7467164.1 hypothetical protein [Armatimonadota bacterium]MDR7493294.1 hypothetical protein [Armatimonadota bacterium]MDR7500143.1 hypothetical protein [Armatimonadota bacterium]
MFAHDGSVGIFAIGVVAGFYFGRFFDRKRDLDVVGFASLLTVVGIGPSALALIAAYREVNLLDAYGVGLLLGVVLNFISVLVAKRKAGGEGRQAEIARVVLSLTGRDS